MRNYRAMTDDDDADHVDEESDLEADACFDYNYYSCSF